MTDANSEAHDMSDGSRFEQEFYQTLLALMKKPDEKSENAFKEAAAKSTRYWQPPAIDLEALLKKDRSAWSKLLTSFCQGDSHEFGRLFTEFKELSPFRDYAFTVLPLPKKGGPYPHGEVMQFATLIEEAGNSWVRVEDKIVTIAIPHTVV